MSASFTPYSMPMRGAHQQSTASTYAVYGAHQMAGIGDHGPMNVTAAYADIDWSTWYGLGTGLPF